jgi:predicted nucleic acid-binding protein
LPTLIDSSVLYASTTTSETRHEEAAAAVRAASNDRLLLPVTILAETMSLVGSRRGLHHQRRLLDGVLASGIEIVPAESTLVIRAREIDCEYEDAGLGFADCMLLATCEHERIERILTFDCMLAVFRPSFAASLQLLP